MDPTPTATAPGTLSVVVPTYKEAANVPVLFERLKSTLKDVPWEMIVVDDDSPDGTYGVAYALAAQDPRIRCLRRVKRSGLSGAVIEGWLSSSADIVAVIDGDLQHDERILPQMYAALTRGEADIAIGTRISDGAEGGLSPARQKLSDLGAWFFRRIAAATISDPMSGFFMVRREIVQRMARSLSPDGFKILVDIMLTAGGTLKVAEVPYSFRKRMAGESKLTPLVGVDFLGLVAHHASGGLLPTRFVLFWIVGALGLVIHVLTLIAFRRLAPINEFSEGQIVATLVAMASNFVLNNEITYRPYRYRGLAQIGGFLAFALGCSAGAIANVSIASMLYQSRETWWTAGLSGALLSVVWNYAVSTNLIWRAGRRK